MYKVFSIWKAYEQRHPERIQSFQSLKFFFIEKLAIITTHPIQYNAPWFRMLTERHKIKLKVFYTWSQSENGLKFDPGFGKQIEWDIPLLEGYEYEFIKNTSKNPGTRTHKGIVNPGLLQSIEAYHPDAVLVNGWNFVSHLKCLKYFHKRIPVFFRGDSTLLNEQKGLRKLARKMVLTRIYRNVDKALYVGTQNKKYFLQNGLKEEQLVFVPHAIDNERFMRSADENEKVAQEWRRVLGISQNKLIFLYAGKFEDVKNPWLILEAAKELESSEVQFLMAGNGPLQSLLKEKAGKNIYFIDFQNQKMMPVLYRLGDVFLLPSKSETWGLSVNESMASSRAVLVTDHCGCATDLVEEGKTGYVFRSNDINELTQKIGLMLQHKDELKDMGKNALDKIQDWSFDHIVEAVENLVINKC
ncbi:MAG: glycosyltransferase family 4 protein [Ginsengibacter sp.]